MPWPRAQGLVRTLMPGSRPVADPLASLILHVGSLARRSLHETPHLRLAGCHHGTPKIHAV